MQVRVIIVVFRGYMWFSESKDKPNKSLLYLQAFSKKYFYNRSDTSVTVQTFNTFARQDPK